MKLDLGLKIIQTWCSVTADYDDLDLHRKNCAYVVRLCQSLLTEHYGSQPATPPEPSESHADA